MAVRFLRLPTCTGWHLSPATPAASDALATPWETQKTRVQPVLKELRDPPVNKITDLTPEQAASLVSGESGSALFLESLTSINAETERVLAGFKGTYLSLGALTTLDADIAKALAEFEGGYLSLKRLTTLDENSDLALAELRREMLVIGLPKLGPGASEALAGFKGDGLDHERLESLPTTTQYSGPADGIRPKAGNIEITTRIDSKASTSPAAPTALSTPPTTKTQSRSNAIWIGLAGMMVLLVACYLGIQWHRGGDA